MAIKIRVARFDPGALIFTPGALAIVPPDEVLDALVRHFAGDWSNLDIFDRQQNERALANDGRLLSSFQSRQGVTFWVITEADRTATTILLPLEY